MHKKSICKEEEPQENIYVINKANKAVDNQATTDVVMKFFVTIGDDQFLKYQWNRKNQMNNNSSHSNYFNDHNETYPMFQDYINQSFVNSASANINEDNNQNLIPKEEQNELLFKQQERNFDECFIDTLKNQEPQPVQNIQMNEQMHYEVNLQPNQKLSMKGLTKLLFKILQNSNNMCNRLLRQVYLKELIKIKPNISQKQQKCALRRFYDIKNILITSGVFKVQENKTSIDKYRGNLLKNNKEKSSETRNKLSTKERSLQAKRNKINFLRNCKKDVMKFVNSNKTKDQTQQKLKLPLIAISLQEGTPAKIILQDHKFLMSGKNLQVYSDLDLIVKLFKKD